MPAKHSTPRPRRSVLRCVLAVVAPLACSGPALSAPDDTAPPEQDSPAIAALLKGGWEIAGYVSTGDNRSSLILFKHPGETYLVQCLTGYDVTRKPRVYSHCYKLR